MQRSLKSAGYSAFLSFALPALVAIAEEPAWRNNMFTQSGFEVRVANTPEKRAELQKLPPNKLVTHDKNGKTYYIYADPNGCRCAYVGSAEAYANFRNGGPGFMGYRNVDGGGSATSEFLHSVRTNEVGGLPHDTASAGSMADFLYPR